jgi:hypothetical protein
MRDRLWIFVVAALLLVAGAVWSLRPVTPAAVTQAELTRLVRQALDFEVMPAVPTVQQVPLGSAPSRSETHAVIQGAQVILSKIYAPNSPQLATQLRGVQNTLEALPEARPVAGGVGALTLRNIRVIGTSAWATWVAQVWSETVTKGRNGVWSPPFKTVNGLYGSAAFTFHNGQWYLLTWDASYLRGEGP